MLQAQRTRMELAGSYEEGAPTGGGGGMVIKDPFIHQLIYTSIAAHLHPFLTSPALPFSLM